MENDGKTLVIKCNNPSVEHVGSENKERGEGNVLMFLRKNSIFIKCSDTRCRRWNRIVIKIPGCNLDFSNASFVQAKMPKKYMFSSVPAPVVLEEKQ